MKPNIELFKSINFLADYLQITPNQIVSTITLFDNTSYAKIKDEYNECVEFYEMPFNKRAEKMGYTVVEKQGNYEITTVL